MLSSVHMVWQLKHTHSLIRKYHYHYFTDEDTKENIISDAEIQDSRVSCEHLSRYLCFCT